MKLSYIDINNFRSIKDQTIKLEPSCRVLVGINESGKSNILKAFSTLSDTYVFSPNDVRNPLPDEDDQEEIDSHIWFVFNLEQAENETAYKQLLPTVLVKNYDSPILTQNGKNFTLKEYTLSVKQVLYRVNVNEQTKDDTGFSINDSYSTLPNWKKPSKTCPPTFTVGDDKKLLANYILINHDDFPEIPSDYLEEITQKYVNTQVLKVLNALTKKSKPEVVYWEYTENNLLPPQIEIATFISNPDSCLPLKYMFNIGKIENAGQSIADAQKAGGNKLKNLLNRVAENTTKHFQKVWKEYKSIKFELAIDGQFINASVKDEFNSYGLHERSDGFKRFVTFLLLISSKYESNHLNNTLLLIDEPEIGLHPSGARYLRDELIKISKNNYVIYSTHSIFMIDENNTKRHIIVEKKKEITTTKDADSSNIVDEEVLYNALGYSIFESLKKKNILFEGWFDKKLFMVAQKKLSSDLKEFYKGVGYCHARGVKSIKTIAPIFELVHRNVLILSDNDVPAKEQKKEFEKNKICGSWKTYSDILPSTSAVTGEDFIKPETFKKSIADIKVKYPQLVDLDTAQLTHQKGKIHVLTQWLQQGGISGDERDAIISEIKNQVFENLKSGEIEDQYVELLKALKDLIPA